ncbi:HEAT repeat domain-containing protein [Candidatus Uabimicrobium sp. HlEnr_7]|uniref:HEAT repeat domain-containing protein n=1 Tax=Candidatus Uabimicrobium helgolandensis TaxID=3095367 RepID=UPI0035566368
MNKLYFCIFLTIVLTGCLSPSQPGTVVDETADERVPRLIQIMHLSKKDDYWRLCQEIIDYKDEALPHLAKNITSFSPKVRTGCMYCISRIYKNTKSDEALELKDDIFKRLEDTTDYVQLEAAASLCDMNDYRGVPVLIGIGLRNNNINIRFRSQQTLKSIFKMNFNYRYEVSEKERESSINRWEKWWEENKTKYI